MGARFLGVALLASTIWFAWHRRDYSFTRAGVRILVLSFAGAILGKLVGIAAYQLRKRMSRFTIARPLFAEAAVDSSTASSSLSRSGT
jgi:hypothetical protein